MPATLFLEETTPQQTLPPIFTGLTGPDEYVYSSQELHPLANGEMARLIETAVYGDTVTRSELVLEVVAADGTSIVRRHELVSETDDDVTIYSPRFVSAPDGSLAILYMQGTFTPGTGADDPGSISRVMIAHTVSPGAETVSAPVILSDPVGAWDIWVYGTVYLEGGDFVVPMSSFDASAFQRIGADGTPVGPVFEPPGSVPYANPRMSALSDDRVAIAWEVYDYVTAATQIRVQILGPDGRAAGETLTVYESEPYAYVNLAHDPSLRFADGSFGVVWEVESGTGVTILLQLFDAGGTPDPDPVILKSASASYSYVIGSAIFADGTFGIITDVSDVAGVIEYQRFDATGAALGDPQVIHSGSGSATTRLLPQGGVALVVENLNEIGEGTTLQGRIFDIDGLPQGPAFELADIGYRSYFDQSILLRADGEVLFDWRVDELTEDRALVGHSPVTFRQLTDANDVLTLTGPEALKTGGGDDQIIGSEGTDRLIGEAGNDTLSGGDGDDFLAGNAGINTLDGGGGTDEAYFDGASDSFTFGWYDAGTVLTVTGADSTDTVRNVERLVFRDKVLTEEQLLVEAGFFDDTLTGTDGDDTLDGGLGDDVVLGEGGNDILRGGDGADRINGGDGDDMIFGGDTEADLRDTIFGGAGNDTIDAGYGNDLVHGMDGDDIIVGGFGSDELQGQNGNDVITGSALSDEVFGGAGDDFVNGGFGHDRVNGGSGADKFYHLGIRDHGSDWVQDYNSAEGDVLLFGNSTATADDFQVNLAHTATPEGERSGDDDVMEAFVIYKPTGQIIWALVDGAGQASINLQISGSGELFDLLA